MQEVQPAQPVERPESQGSRHAAGSPGPVGAVPDFIDWLEGNRATIDEALAAHLKELETDMGPHSRLPAAVQYSMKLGGKRLRPILVLEACRACGGRAEQAMPAALAIECVHTFSLIHDDLPAMDNDDLRRGQPTNHKVFGEALAILAGDWLAAHAFALLAADRVDRALVPTLLHALAEGTQLMIEGQGADIENEQRPTDGALVQYIHAHKTAALIETCCRLGALCAGAPGDAVTALARYGRHLGLAFQIVDDLLDATGSSAKLGKGVRKDAVAAKQTYPAAFGLEESQARASHEVEAALRVLDAFGSRMDRLRDLARYVVARDR
jgi:geranylgeranyl diphosphate synthase type II